MTDVACPVREDFDPLSERFLADPYAVLASLPVAPVFFASLGYYVVTRYADIESVFLDPDSYSAAAAQLPLVPLIPEAMRILAEGGHRPQPSMVSLDPPAHTRLRRPASRAFTPRRVAAMEPRIRATVEQLLDAIDVGAAERHRALGHAPPCRDGSPSKASPRASRRCGSSKIGPSASTRTSRSAARSSSGSIPGSLEYPRLPSSADRAEGRSPTAPRA